MEPIWKALTAFGSELDLAIQMRTYYCGVVGIPNLEWGEIIGAAIVPETDNFDIEELKSWLHKKLPGYKTPRKYMFMSDLPRNVMGKVTKNNIKELFTTNQ